MKEWIKFALAGGVPFLISYIIFTSMNSNSWSAAWVQAVGSIAAILVAVYIPSKLEVTRQQREKEERERIESVAQHTLILEVSVIRAALIQYKVLIDKNVDLIGLDAYLMPENFYGQMSGGGDRLNVFLSLEEKVMGKYTTLIAMMMNVEIQRKILLTISELGEINEENISYMVSLFDESLEVCDELMKIKPNVEDSSLAA